MLTPNIVRKTFALLMIPPLSSLIHSFVQLTAQAATTICTSCSHSSRWMPFRFSWCI
jgi:hypothetical protein